jgi:hypothetical protein
LTCYKVGTWDRLFYFPSEGRYAEDFFTSEKIQRLRSDSNPRTREPEASMLTTRQPKPSKTGIVLCSTVVRVQSASLFNQLLVQALGVLQVRKEHKHIAITMLSIGNVPGSGNPMNTREMYQQANAQWQPVMNSPVVPYPMLQQTSG